MCQTLKKLATLQMEVQPIDSDTASLCDCDSIECRMQHSVAVPSKKRRRTRRFCQHCNCFVSKSAWYNHRSHLTTARSPGQEPVGPLDDEGNSALSKV